MTGYHYLHNEYTGATVTISYLLRGVVSTELSHCNCWNPSQSLEYLLQAQNNFVVTKLLLGQPQLILATDVFIPEVLPLHQWLHAPLHKAEGHPLRGQTFLLQISYPVQQLGYLVTLSEGGLLVPQGVVHWRIHTGLWQLRGVILDIEPLILPALVVLSQLIIKV